MNRKRLYLIDGMSHIYRAYYAIRNLKTSKGLVTNAIYGFTVMLRKLIHEENPDYLAVAFDLDGPNVRQERFQGYKATRKPMPEDLVQQLPYIRRVCEAFRVPVIGVEGYEADDVIGTLSIKAVEHGLASIVVTSDKDMLQLVSKHIVVLDPAKDNLILDAQKVVEKLGVTPEQVCDLLGLWGDSSDNIPGAPGIGEKGARELIQTFGTLENCLSCWDKVKKKTYQASLRDNAQLIRTSYELVCIRRDLPIDLDLEAFRLSEPDRKKAFELFAELEFKNLMKEFVDEESKEFPRAEWRSGESAVLFLQALAGQQRIYLTFGYDEGLLARKIANVACIQGESGPAALIDLNEEGCASALAALMQNPSVTKVCWDAKLCRLSRAVNGACVDAAVEDVMMLAFLTAPHVGDYSLRRWALEHLHTDLGESNPIEGGLLATADQRDSIAESLSRKVAALRQLHEILSASLNSLELQRVYRDIELPLIPLLAEMESAGVRIDPEMLQRMSGTMQQQVDDLTRKIFVAAGTEFNINSTKQIGEVLFERMNLPILKKTRKTGGYSTDQAVLEELASSYEIARLILEYRQITKLKSTYVDSLPALIHPATGRVHTSYNQTGAATGRISSSDPNLQNIPIRTELGRLIRGAFIAGEGNILISADYSQIELRVMAHLSGDERLIASFRNNEDIHARTAEEVFGLQYKMNPFEFRRRAKVINFGIIYGLSAFGLAAKLGISRHEAQAFIDAYFQRYQGVRAWLEKTLEEARATGAVRTLFGRFRPIPDIRSKDFNARNFAERAAINSPIQGTAADIIKLAMIRLHEGFRQKRLSARMIMQVHDELVLELPRQEAEEVEALARSEMENAVVLNVPLVVDVYVADNWKDMK